MLLPFASSIAPALSGLTPVDQHILSHRGAAEWLGRSPRTLQALATDMRITRERVRQLEQRAWRRLLTAVAGMS